MAPAHPGERPGQALRSVGGVPVGAVGLGGAGWSLSEPPPPRAQSIATIHAALEAGVTLIDTARAYTTLDEPAHNEALVAEALRSHPRGADALAATKGGHWRAGPSDFPVDGRPEALRRDAEASLAALGVERIGLYQLHWPDPRVPVEESVGALADLRVEGKIQLIGLSNVTPEQIDAARSVTAIASVQNHLSAEDRGDLGTLRHCQARGIAYLAYSPLGGGSRRRTLEEALPAFADVAMARGISVQRVALAWMLALSPALVPLAGARRPASIVDSVGAADVVLTAEEVARLTGDASP